MTERIDFSVGKKHHKVIDIIDAWKMKGSYSDKICAAITKQYEDEQRGSKLTVWTGQQSKLPTLPPVYESLKPSDLQGLTSDEIQTIYYALGQSLTVVEKAIRKAEALR